MSKENNLRRMKQGEVVSRKRMYKANKQWVVAGTSLLMGVGLATVTTTEAHASEEDGIWEAHTSDQIAQRIAPGQTKLTFTWGDTYWEIGKALNIDAFKLMAMNGLHDGDQYTIPVGHVVHWDGNHVTVKDGTGKTISDQVISDEEKIDSSKTVASQKSDTPSSPVQVDENGHVIRQKEDNTTSPKLNQKDKNEAAKPNAKDDNNSLSSNHNSLPGVSQKEDSVEKNPEDKIEDKTEDKVEDKTDNQTEDKTEGNIENNVETKPEENKPEENKPEIDVEKPDDNDEDDSDEVTPPTNQPLVVNKIDLIKKIEEASSVDETFYTEDSLKNLTELLNRATTVRNNEDATQEQVNAAERNLIDAINDLVEKPMSAPVITVDKEDLIAKIQEANSLDASLYTEDSLKKLTETLAYSQNVKNNPDATQETVDKALDTLNTAIKDLVKKPVAPPVAPPVVAVDKAALTAKIEDVKKVDASLYTKESLKHLTDALGKAKTVNNNASATQKEVDAALQDLTTALNGLEKKPVTPPATPPVVSVNKTDLEKKITEAKNVDKKIYTEDSFKKVTDALEAGETVKNNTKATQKEVDTALNDLTKALKELVKKSTTPQTSTIKISYKNEDGKVLKSTTITGNNGTSQEVKADNRIMINNERFKLVDTPTKTVRFGETSEVSFAYAPDKVNITINYVFDDGTPKKQIVTPVQVGKLFIAEAKEFEGYTLKGGKYHFVSVRQDYQIVFQYTKKTN